MKMFLKFIASIEEAICNEKSEIVEDEVSYRIYHTTGASELKSLLELDFDEVFGYFGPALRITITPKNQATTVYTQDRGVDFFIEELTEYAKDDNEVNCIFNINKTELIKDKLGDSVNSSYLIRIFKDQDSFARYLELNNIFSLQKQLYEKGKKLVLLIPDMIQCYDNGLVKILGNCPFEHLKSNIGLDTNIELLNKLQERVALRDREVRWEDKYNYIAPDYFYFKEIDNNILMSIFSKMTIDCIITFLADTIKIIEDQYICQFNGYKCTEIILDDKEYEKITINKNSCDTAFDLYNWTYESNFVDKIMIVRNIISKYLKENNKLNYAEFLNNSPDIFNASKANYSIYFQSKIDLFFEDRKKIVQYTFDKTKDVEKEINNLTDSMTKNVITAVGVILAAIIANSTKSSYSVIGIKVAISAYMFYLGISVMYNLVTPVISLIQQCSSNSHLIKYYTTFVPEDEIKKVQGNVFKNKLIFFWVYWGLSLLLIAFLIGFSIYSITNIQDLLTTLNTL